MRNTEQTKNGNHHEVVPVFICEQERDIDADLAECVRLLNKVGLVTKNCCQGDIPGDPDYNAHAYIQFFGPNLLVEHLFNGTGSPGEDPESIPSVIIRWQRIDKVTPEAVESGEADFTRNLSELCDAPWKTPLGVVYDEASPERVREYLTYIADPVNSHKELHWVGKVAKVVNRLIAENLPNITLTEDECRSGVGHRKITSGIPPKLKQEIGCLYQGLRRDWNVNVATMDYSNAGIYNRVKMEATCHVPFNAKLNKWYLVIPASGDIVLRQMIPYSPTGDAVVVVDIVVGTLAVDFT
jgi:hypothetical protein